LKLCGREVADAWKYITVVAGSEPTDERLKINTSIRRKRVMAFR
jgi:hypothetical protein